MKKTGFVLLLAFGLTGCLTAQQYPPAPPSVSQIQGQCMLDFQKFLDQVGCIESNLRSYSYAAPNPFVQEYVAYMQALSTKVKAGKVSEDDARVKLAQRLNDLRQQQDSELAVQQGLANQRAMQTYQILQQNKPAPLEVHKIEGLPPAVNTHCQTYGNQVDCTSR